MQQLSKPLVRASNAGRGVTATLVRYPIGFSLPPHGHDDCCIQVVRQGEFHERGWRDGDVFPAGEAMFRPAGFEHSNAAARGSSTGLSIRFDPAAMPEPLSDAMARAVPTRTRDPRIELLAVRVRRELASADALSASMIEVLCVEAAVHLLRGGTAAAAGPSSRVVDRAAAFIRGHVGELLTVESIADEVGVDRFRLNRAFLRFRGCSPSEFVRLVRIEAAERLVRGTDRPLAIVAADCGFADQSHMTRTFRATLGISPARLRERRPEP